MDSVLILGAGLMQRPAINSAKNLGYKTYVVDADEKAVCVKEADVFKKIDLKAKEEIAEFASTIENLKAVFTAGTDFSASVSYVSEKLGLSSHNFDAATNASNKVIMRGCFSKAGVPSPAFIKVSKDDIPAKGSDIELPAFDFPFVVKPCDNMGGRGCRMVRSKEEYFSALENAVNNSRSGTSIVEEYMEGPEYSIDALVYNGTFTVTGFAIRHIKYPPYFIEVGHTMPAVLSKKEHDELISVFALGAKSLGLTCGAAKADIKYTKNGPMIGEIAGRLSGGYMSGWTFPYASDMNLTEQGLLIALGKEPSNLVSRRVPVDYNPGEKCAGMEKPYELYEIPCEKASAERAWISIPGTVSEVNLPEKKTFVEDFLPRATVSLGGKVDFPRNNVQKCGNVITRSENRDSAIQAAESTVSDIFIRLKTGDAATENFLKGTSASDEESFPPSAFPVDEKVFDKITGTITEGETFASALPECLKTPEYENLLDWNYLSMKEALSRVDRIVPEHKSVDKNKFFQAFLRGSVQLSVYYLDCEENK
ncbi:MAG: ATP-grasp domain-containing protein [Treponema sp.]|nr:ATP-grasp domain-containing protein [Treponema sp.]